MSNRISVEPVAAAGPLAAKHRKPSALIACLFAFCAATFVAGYQIGQFDARSEAVGVFGLFFMIAITAGPLFWTGAILFRRAVAQMRSSNT